MASPYWTSRLHSLDTPHLVGLLCTSDQPDRNTSTSQHTTLTRDIQVPGGSQTHDPRKRAAAYPRLRQGGHWDRRIKHMFTKKQNSGIAGPRDHWTSTVSTTTYQRAEKYPSLQIISIKYLKLDEVTEQVKAEREVPGAQSDTISYIYEYHRDEFKIVILTVPLKFLLPSPVKLCGTDVKAATTGRLCDYRAEEKKVSWVMTALNVCRCRPEENNVQVSSCPMSRDIRKNIA